MGVNISKYKFFTGQIEYLGHWITIKGIQTKRNKAEAILNIKALKTRKRNQIRQFIVKANYYRCI
jgi:hypothetical protein